MYEQATGTLYQPASDGISMKCKYAMANQQAVKFKVTFIASDAGHTVVTCKQQQGKISVLCVRTLTSRLFDGLFSI